MKNRWQALTVTRLTRSPYTTKIARIRRYTMPSTVFTPDHGSRPTMVQRPTMVSCLTAVARCCSRLQGVHRDLHGVRAGLVPLRRGVHVVRLGLPGAQHHQHHHAALRQVRQLLQPAHLLRHELQVPQGGGGADALHPEEPRGGAAEALPDPWTQGRGRTRGSASCSEDREQIRRFRAEPEEPVRRPGGDWPPSQPVSPRTGRRRRRFALTHRNVAILVRQTLKDGRRRCLEYLTWNKLELHCT